MEKGREARDYRKLAMNFWAQARANLATATTLVDAGIYYASVFFSQQAAEMALKAAMADHLHRSAAGHNLIQMANALEAPVEVMNAAAELNPEFLLTRNPDSLDGVPAQLYDRSAARLHLRCARQILDWAKSLV
ncbi:MAG: HEPN domain-containing protein [Armatimonadetes bacterium]|nr:HEPN domain-containing protein [Armatimonadota bacterium]